MADGQGCPELSRDRRQNVGPRRRYRPRRLSQIVTERSATRAALLAGQARRGQRSFQSAHAERASPATTSAPIVGPNAGRRSAKRSAGAAVNTLRRLCQPVWQTDTKAGVQFIFK